MSTQEGGRRVINVGAHGHQQQMNIIANQSINQRLMDNIDLNASSGSRRFDQVFDQQDQQLNYSSRLNYASELKETAAHQLKRSETENIIRGASPGMV